MMKSKKKVSGKAKGKGKKGKKLAAAVEHEQKPKGTKSQSEPQQRIPPYIRIEGTWNAPSVVKIVNAHAKEDEADGKVTAKLTKASQYIDKEHRDRAEKVGFTSTLSERYDTQTRDTSWVCVFCQNYTHMDCLGDLYGPYFISQVPPESIWFSKKNPDSLEASDHHPPQDHQSPSKKSKKSPKKASISPAIKEEPHADTPGVSVKTQHEASSSEERTEVWFHESCLVWAPGICLIPPRLVGLDEAVSDSRQAVCEYCRKIGAHIFCRSRGCGLRCHFPCARSHGWLLEEDKFLALCPAHTQDHQLGNNETKTS